MQIDHSSHLMCGADRLADTGSRNTLLGGQLADMVVEELRCRGIRQPPRTALEAIIHVEIRRGIRIAHRALAAGLSEGQKLDLDNLLDLSEETSVTVLA